MGLKYNNYSSWREQFVHLQGGLNTLDFLDTNPNMFVVQNITGTDIYCSISTIPNNDNYEYLVNKHSTVTLGRPTSTNKLHFYNPTNNQITLKVFSLLGDFDMNILKNVTVRLDADAAIKTDGIIKGFGTGVSLPSGTNTLGKVEIENPIDLSTVETLLTEVESNAATSILQNQILEKLENVIVAIGNISGGSGSTPTITKTQVIHNFSIGNLGSGDNIVLNHIEMLQNNSNTDVTINIYVDASNYFSISIPSGESVSDIDLDIYKVTSTHSNVLIGGYVYAN